MRGRGKSSSAAGTSAAAPETESRGESAGTRAADRIETDPWSAAPAMGRAPIGGPRQPHRNKTSQGGPSFCAVARQLTKSDISAEKEAQDALKEASDNFPGPLGTLASGVMKMGCFPLGSITRPYKAPNDHLTKEVSRLLTTPSGLRDLFVENVYVAPEDHVHLTEWNKR